MVWTNSTVRWSVRGKSGSFAGGVALLAAALFRLTSPGPCLGTYCGGGPTACPLPEPAPLSAVLSGGQPHPRPLPPPPPRGCLG
eukprot:2070010-Rhodomonas_salina.1